MFLTMWEPKLTTDKHVRIEKLPKPSRIHETFHKCVAEKQEFLSNENPYIWTGVPFEKKTQFPLTKRALTFV